MLSGVKHFSQRRFNEKILEVKIIEKFFKRKLAIFPIFLPVKSKYVRKYRHFFSRQIKVFTKKLVFEKCLDKYVNDVNSILPILRKKSEKQFVKINTRQSRYFPDFLLPSNQFKSSQNSSNDLDDTK